VARRGNTRLLGYGLAIVALATVFPILVGEPQWDAGDERISGWQPPAEWLARALGWSHSVLITGSIAVACIAVFAILALMVRMATQRWLTTKDPLFGYGGSIKNAWALVSDAGVSRSDLAAADREAAREVAAVFDKLLEAKGGRTELARLRARVEGFVVAQALLVGRPVGRDCTPLVASVFRYQGEKLLDAPAIGDKEVDIALQHYEIAAEDFGDATRLTKLSPLQCCMELEREPALRNWLEGADRLQRVEGSSSEAARSENTEAESLAES
jgi:hypothetical protein